jgi:hypothetical protein
LKDLIVLRIRPEQDKALSDYMLRSFKKRVLAHLRKCFPKKCEAMDTEKLMELIREGIKRSRSYGIETERNVMEFIDLMVVFGRNFDTDKTYPQAAKILADKDADGPKKIDRLYAMFNDIPEEEAGNSAF